MKASDGFNMMFDATTAYMQLGYMLGGLVCLGFGVLFLGLFIYGHAAGLKTRGRVAAIRVSGAVEPGELTPAPPVPDPPPPARKENQGSFGEMFRKTPSAGLAAVFAILFLFGVPTIFVGAGAWFGVDYAMLVMKGVEVQATVVDNEYSHSSGHGRHHHSSSSYHAVVTFTDSNGVSRRIRDKISVGSSPSYPTGSQVVVHYDSANPEHAVVGGFWHNALLPIAFMGMGSLFLLLILNSKRLQEKTDAFSVRQSKKYYTGETYYTVYEYQGPDGRIVRGTDGSGQSWIGKLPGTPVWLHVNQKNPEKVMMGTPLLLLFGVVFSFPGLLFLYAAFAHFKFNIFTVLIPLAVIAHGMIRMRDKLDPQKIHATFIDIRSKMLEAKAAPTSTAPAKLEGARELSLAEIKTRLRARNRANGVIAPLFLLFGIGLLAAGAHLGKSTADMLAKGARVSGQVAALDSTYSSDSHGSHYSYHAIVDFSLPDGRQQEFRDSLGSSSPLNAVGDTVRVIYDPVDPAHAIIDRGLWNWAFAGGLSLGGILMLLIALSGLVKLRQADRL